MNEKIPTEPRKDENREKEPMKSAPPSKTTQMEKGVEEAVHEKNLPQFAKEHPKTDVTPIPEKKN